MSLSEKAPAEDAELEISELLCDGQRACAGRRGLIQLSELRMDVRHERRNSAPSSVVVQAFGNDLCLMETLQSPPQLAELVQDRSQLEADLEGLFEGGLAFRQSSEHSEHLLEPGPGVPQRGSCGGLETGLLEVVNRFLTQVAPEGMMGQPLGVLPESIAVKRLDRLDDPRVKLTAAIVQQAAICHLVSQRVLERVLEVWIEAGLVEELGSLQTVKSITERLLGKIGNRLQQCERNVLAHNGGSLQ